MCLRMCIFFPKCQLKDTTFLFKCCFAYVLTAKILYVCQFHLCSTQQLTRRTQNSLFPATSINLPITLRGCYPDIIMSASQRITTRNHYTLNGLFPGGRREVGESEEVLLLQSSGCWACGENMGTTGKSVAELGCTCSAENSYCRYCGNIGTYCQLLL